MSLVDTLFQDAPPSNYPVKISRFDRINIEEMREASDEWRTLEAQRKQEWGKFPEAMETFFASLYKPKPIREENLTQVGNALRQILDEAEATTEWQQFRRETILDEVASAIGAIAIGKSITLPEDPPEGEDGSGEGQGELPQEQLDQIRREIRKAVREAQQEVDGQRAAEALIWGNEAGSLSKERTPQERISLANRIKNNDRLRRLLDLVGRMRFVAAQQHRRRVLHGRDELADVTLGNDLRDIIPQELMYLGESDLETWFFWRWAEKNLLQYHFEATEKVGRGPIIVRIDVSYSMKNMLYGTSSFGSEGIPKIDWALAIALSLTMIAQKEKRDLRIGLFNTQMLQEWVFPQGRSNPDTILEIASVGVSGGTLFEPPLRSAVQVVQEAEYKKADILFITDGISSVSPAFLEWYDQVKAEKEFRVFSIAHSYGVPPILDRLSDEVCTITDLQSGEQAMHAVFSL